MYQSVLGMGCYGKWIQWQVPGWSCPLEELMGTPAGDRDILGLFTPSHFMRFL